MPTLDELVEKKKKELGPLTTPGAIAVGGGQKVTTTISGREEQLRATPPETLRDQVIDLLSRIVSPGSAFAPRENTKQTEFQRRQLTFSRQIADFFVPVDEVEVGALAGSLATGGATAALGKFAPRAAQIMRRGLTGLGTRAAGTLAGAEAGALVGGQEPGGVATRVLASSVLGESLASLLTKFNAVRVQRILSGKETRRIGRILEDVEPSFAGIKTEADLVKVMLGATGRDALSEAYENSLTKIEGMLAGNLLNVPALSSFATGRSLAIPMPFDELKLQLTRLGRRAFRKGAALETPAGFDYQQLYADALDQLGGELKRFPQAHRAFTEMQSRYAQGTAIVDAFEEVGADLLTPEGKLNRAALQKVVGFTNRRQLERKLKPENVERFVKQAIFSGEEPAAVDIPGRLAPRIEASPGRGMPAIFISPPRFPRIVGQPRVPPQPFTLSTLLGLRETFREAGPSLPMQGE